MLLFSEIVLAWTKVWWRRSYSVGQGSPCRVASATRRRLAWYQQSSVVRGCYFHMCDGQSWLQPLL